MPRPIPLVILAASAAWAASTIHPALISPALAEELADAPPAVVASVSMGASSPFVHLCGAEDPCGGSAYAASIGHLGFRAHAGWLRTGASLVVAASPAPMTGAIFAVGPQAGPLFLEFGLGAALHWMPRGGGGILSARLGYRVFGNWSAFASAEALGPSIFRGVGVEWTP